jgi:hypothetical protein
MRPPIMLLQALKRLKPHLLTTIRRAPVIEIATFNRTGVSISCSFFVSPPEHISWNIGMPQLCLKRVIILTTLHFPPRLRVPIFVHSPFFITRLDDMDRIKSFPWSSRSVARRIWPIVSVLFYMLLHLIFSLKPVPPSPRTRVFAAIDGTVIELCRLFRIAVFGLGVAGESLTLRETLIAALC